MKNILDYVNNRLDSHRKAIKKLSTIENARKRHPAYKQLHGRILELQVIKKELEK
jgi:hypothetical protein